LVSAKKVKKKISCLCTFKKVPVDRLPGVPSEEESIKKVTVDRLLGVTSQEESIKKVTVDR
jgi:hypothetical protein